MSICFIKKFPMAFLALVALVCVGCGEQKLDTSNDQAYTESLKLIYEAVPEGDREEFRKNYTAVLSDKVKGVGSGTLNEKRMYEVYSMTKVFGRPSDGNVMLPFNGLTASEIAQQGKAIREKKEQEQNASRKKRLEDKIKQAKEYITTLEGEVKKEESLAKAPTQIEVISDAVEALEGFNFEKKSWGTVGSFVVYITVKNNSAETIKKIEGEATIKDKAGNKVNTIWLSNLRPVGGDDKSYSSDLKIAPGTEWKGQVVLKEHGPNKKYPFPPVTEYIATLSDVEIKFDSNPRWGGFSSQSSADRLAEAKANLSKMEKELASIQ